MDIDLLTIGYTSLDRFLTFSGENAKIISQDNTNYLGFVYGDKIPTDTFQETLGGNPANAAVTGSRLGLKTAIWTVLGDDHVGHQAKLFFEKEGIATDLVEFDNKIHTAVHTILVYDKDRSILLYGEQPEYSLPQLPNASWIYFTSLQPSGNAIGPELASKLDPQTKLVYQPGTYQLELKASGSKELLAKTHLIALNREEAEEYLEIDTTSGRPSFNELCKKFHEYGVKIALITDAQNGAYASDGESLYYCGIEDVSVVEKTGAGDSYASAFTVALAKNKTIEEAMKWGLLNSQSVIGKVGPQAGILHINELEELISQNRPNVTVERKN